MPTSRSRRSYQLAVKWGAVLLLGAALASTPARAANSADSVRSEYSPLTPHHGSYRNGLPYKYSCRPDDSASSLKSCDQAVDEIKSRLNGIVTRQGSTSTAIDPPNYYRERLDLLRSLSDAYATIRVIKARHLNPGEASAHAG